MKFGDYYEIREWLEGFIPLVYGKEKLGLVRIEYLLKLLGNPQNKFKSIHIAGTSGKGSTAFYTAKLLQLSVLGSQLSDSSQSVGQLTGKPKTEKLKSENRKLRTDNWKIGLHVSPHLVDIRERMQVFSSLRHPEERSDEGSIKNKEEILRFTQNDNNNLMPMSQFIHLMSEIKSVVEKIQRTKPELTPSYFEILVAASFKYFAQEKVDWAVVEVGLGGRLDATNVLQPEICVITNVGLDHTEILGKTIEKIAYEKAGIIKSATTEDTESGHENTEKEKTIEKHLRGEGKPLSGEHLGGEIRKPGIPVVTAAKGKALEVIEKVAKEKGSRVIKVDTQKLAKELPIQSYSDGPFLAYVTIKTLTPSRHSGLSRIDSGVSANWRIPRKTEIKKIFSETFPGRFEEIDHPTSSGKAGLRGAGGVILDGAHNPDKVKALIRWIKNRSTVYRLQTTAVDRRQWTVVLVIAFKKGKNWKEMVDLLVKNLPVKKVMATKFWATTDMGKFQAVEPEEIAKYVNGKWKMENGKFFTNSQEAVFEAMKGIKASKRQRIEVPENIDTSTRRHVDTGDLLLVTGSLYLVGEVRTMWQLPSFARQSRATEGRGHSFDF